MLSDKDILKELNRSLRIDPLVPENVQPASVDLRLDREFWVAASGWARDIDPRQDCSSLFRAGELVEHPTGPPYFLLEPGMFVLASTFERVSLNAELAAKVEGKSSLGRLGLLVHATAGFIDPGFEGQVTLELANLTPRRIRLYPGMLIAQVCFFRLETPATSVYGAPDRGSHYAKQKGPTLSRGWQNFAISPLP